MKRALIRAARTAAQTFAAALVALPTVGSIGDIKTVAEPVAVAVYTALVAFAVSFLHNIAEEGRANYDRG